jgi:multiple sugar transport system ATP-binding protein
MSGGQRQRAAIGRAIVKQPKLFLLDEPLSNLDAALRNRTRVELAQLRQRVDAALIMVTHDQAEAMTLADRMVVMNDRKIQQVGAPMEIYARPANAFVARFVGSPAMTLAPAAIAPGEGPYARVRLVNGAEIETRVARQGLPENGSVQLGLRPEHLSVTAPGAGAVDAEAVLVERLGDRTLVYARLSDGLEVTAQDEGNSRVRMSDRIGLRIDGAAAHLFGPDGTGYHADAAA